MKRNGLFKKLVISVVFGALFLGNVFAETSPLKITQQDLIYFAFTDRFCDGDASNNQNAHKKDPGAYHGGDFQGIIDKLDYIKDLGFTTVWISPVVANQIRGYHGYWPIDFYKTNENFGSLEKLKELVATAHAKGIKIIVDLVVNHTGVMHPLANDPEFYSWFHHRGRIDNWNDQQVIEEGNLAELPDLKQENPEVKKYLIDMAKWWIRETGIDGYRLDTVRHVSKNFWSEFVVEIKKEYPNFYFLGEVLDGNAGYVAGYQNAGLDGMVDFPLYFALNDVFKDNQPASRLTNMIEECHNRYSNPNLMGTFIDNHDVPRFLNQLYDLPAERQKQALTFIMTYTGIPVFYYGTEFGMDGGEDPDNRRDIDWSVKSPLTEYIKTLTTIRKNNKALTYGDFQLVKVEADFLCYMRCFEGNIIITAFNLSDEKKKVELVLPQEFQSKKVILKELTSTEKVKTVKVNQGKVQLKMDPRQVDIFSVSNQ